MSNASSTRPGNEAQSPGVFISYRRDDSAGHVGRLYDALAARFGQSAVFMDIDHIKPGENFVDVLHRSIAACRVLLVVIGPHWLGARTTAGARRIDDSRDFVRAEIAAGLRRNMLVIPVLVHGAAMPEATDLPADLQPLVQRQAFRLDDQRWRHDIDHLLQLLAPHVAPQQPSRRVSLTPRLVGGALALSAVLFTATFLLLRNESSPPAPLNEQVDSAITTPTSSRSGSEPLAGPRTLVEEDLIVRRPQGVAQPQPEVAARRCGLSHADDGLLVEALGDSECDYVIYEAPLAATPLRFEIEGGVRRYADAWRQRGNPGSYGVALSEARPADPDSVLRYRGVIVGIDNFRVAEAGSLESRPLLSPNFETWINAGENAVNQFRVEMYGRSTAWFLNDHDAGRLTSKVPLGRRLAVFVSGRGMQVVFRNLRAVELPASRP